MIDTARKDTPPFGFEPVRDETGLRLKYVMPADLEGHLYAEFLCRGSLLDGTEGVPSRIIERIEDELACDSIVAPWQVHGTAVLEGRPIWTFPQRPKADGVHLDRCFAPNGSVRGSLRFADCAPILLASSFPHPWVLMLHSGFKGTLFRIFPTAWLKIRSFYGELDPSRTFAWIGPSIGACCYTRKLTDPLAIKAMKEWEGHVTSKDGQLAYFDLLGVIEEQIKGVGLPRENIYRMNLCTSCNRDSFYSYRAGDPDDRMVLIAKLI